MQHRVNKTFLKKIVNKLINIRRGYKIMVGTKRDSVAFDVHVVSCHWKSAINVSAREKAGGVHSEVKLGAGANDEWTQALNFVVP